jgi:hypothetical protein
MFSIYTEHVDMICIYRLASKYPFTIFVFLKFEFSLLLLQIWKMPKLWVGFLKLAYQTQPRSFDVLLQVLLLVFYVFIRSWIYILVFLLTCHDDATCSYLRHSLKLHWISIRIFDHIFLPLLISGTCTTSCPGTRR